MERWRPDLKAGTEFPRVLERIGGLPVGLPSKIRDARVEWLLIAQIFARWEDQTNGQYPVLYIFRRETEVETELVLPVDINHGSSSFVGGLAIVDWIWIEEEERFTPAEANLFCNYDGPSPDCMEEYLEWTEKSYRGGVLPLLNVQIRTVRLAVSRKIYIAPGGRIVA
jgi:hypothetical protein